MTEKDLYKFMAKKMNSDEKEAQRWVEIFIDGICEGIEQRESLTIRNFGKFYLRETSNGSIVFKFLLSKKLKSLVGYA